MKRTPHNQIVIAGSPGQCPVCHHPPIRHVEDGTGATCIICAAAQEAYVADVAAGRSPQMWPGCKPGFICTLKFRFKLSKVEREQAEKADKGSYPPRTVCANELCGLPWEAHSGYLCPSGDSTFVPLLESAQPFLITH